jgi:hypothetical protein
MVTVERPVRDPAVAPGAALRFAGLSLGLSAVVSAIGMAFLVAMFASFAAGAQSDGQRFGRINDVLIGVTYVLILPAIVAVHLLVRDRWPVRSLIVAAIGVVLVVVIVILQGALVTDVLTFEEQIGPVSIVFVALAGWFVAAGWLVTARGIARHGVVMGLLAATYVAYPVWAIWLARALGERAGRRVDGRVADRPAA